MGSWDTELKYFSTIILWSYSFFWFDWFDFFGMIAISLDPDIRSDVIYSDICRIDNRPRERRYDRTSRHVNRYSTSYSIDFLLRSSSVIELYFASFDSL